MSVVVGMLPCVWVRYIQFPSHSFLIKHLCLNQKLSKCKSKINTFPVTIWHEMKLAMLAKQSWRLLFLFCPFYVLNLPLGKKEEEGIALRRVAFERRRYGGTRLVFRPKWPKNRNRSFPVSVSTFRPFQKTDVVLFPKITFSPSVNYNTGSITPTHCPSLFSVFIRWTRKSTHRPPATVHFNSWLFPPNPLWTLITSLAP